MVFWKFLNITIAIYGPIFRDFYIGGHQKNHPVESPSYTSDETKTGETS